MHRKRCQNLTDSAITPWRRTLKRANSALENLVGLSVTRFRPDRQEERETLEPLAQRALQLVQGRTMAPLLQQYSTYSAAKYVASAGIPGDVVECGVWRGGSAMLLALGLIDGGDASRRIFLFDTYTGMTHPTLEDRRLSDDAKAEDLLRVSPRWGRVASEHTYWCVADEQDVMSGMTLTNYDMSLIATVRGDVLETLQGAAPDLISIARLDTDWYLSTKHELEVLFDRISPGGVLILDDYDYWGGARQATDEFFLDRGLAPFLIRPDSGRIFIKPG